LSPQVHRWISQATTALVAVWLGGITALVVLHVMATPPPACP
jgi:hypothetical protein